MPARIKIDCTPTERRQLLGQPDILPLCEVVSRALDLSLMALLTRLAPPLAVARPARRTRQTSRQTASGG